MRTPVARPEVIHSDPAVEGRAQHGGGAPAALVAVIVTLLVGYALKLTYTISMPLALAFFFAAAVHPVQSSLRRHLPRWLRGLDLLAALIVVVAALSVLVGAVWLAGELVAPRMADYADQLQQHWNSLRRWGQTLGIPLPAPSDNEEGADIVGRLSGTLGGFASSFMSFLVLLVLALFFMLLMLGEAGRWRDKTATAVGESAGRHASEVVRVVAGKIRIFILVRTAASIVSGVVAGVWLWLIGVELAFVWGLLFFILNYIPNIGSVIAAVPPTAVALMQLGPVWALIAVGGLILNEQIIGNYVDPKLQGRNLDISPLVVLVSVVLWGWVWGIVGALIAVPMTVSLLVAFSRIEALRPIALLLSASSDFEELDEGVDRPPNGR
jgi:AI-2 transport protein TqsA